MSYDNSFTPYGGDGQYKKGQPFLPKSEVEKSSVSDPQTTETLGKKNKLTPQELLKFLGYGENND